MPAKVFIKAAEDAGRGLVVGLKSANKEIEQKAETQKNVKSGGKFT